MAAAVATLAAVGACSRQSGQAAAPPVSVTVEAARLDSLRDLLTASGTVVPALAADWIIYAPEAGRIVELPKGEGEAVQVGDLLVRFDLASVAQDLADRQADVARARAQADSATAEHAKQSSLFDRGLTARNTLETAATAQAAAEAALASATALLAATTTLAERAVVRARFAGVIAKRWHAVGDAVTATTNDPVLRVIDPTRVQVTVPVSGPDLVRIVPGQQAAVTPVGGGASQIAAVVMRPAAPDPGATTAEVRLSFSSPTTMLADTPVQVEIVRDERPNVVAVPAASIGRADGLAWVMIAGADGVAHRRDVRVGLVTASLAEIVWGVKPGDLCIVRGLGDVSDGARITIDRGR
jgi:RND family efflux transporter MFP subunit